VRPGSIGESATKRCALAASALFSYLVTEMQYQSIVRGWEEHDVVCGVCLCVACFMRFAKWCVFYFNNSKLRILRIVHGDILYLFVYS